MRARTNVASAGIGAIAPVFAMPADFVQRVGTRRYDDIFTGTFKHEGRTIGFLRVGSFEYLDSTAIEDEIRYMEENTDGMIVDVMRNPGGLGCAAESLLRYFAPNGIRSVGNSVRATWEYIQAIHAELEYAKMFGATDEELAELQMHLNANQAAFAKNRGMTEPLPICGASVDLKPAVDDDGAQVTYSKPVMILIDERTASAAELFAAAMQDAGRGMIYGYRTAGAGGAVDHAPAGIYSETAAGLARSIMIRKQNISSAEYPAMPYVENIGVRPDKTADYMTVDNLLQNGAPFVSGVLSAMGEHIATKSVN
jgi:hypothetical protein